MTPVPAPSPPAPRPRRRWGRIALALSVVGLGGSWLCAWFLPTEDQPAHAPAFADRLLLAVDGAFVLALLSGLLLGIFAVATGALRRRPPDAPP